MKYICYQILDNILITTTVNLNMFQEITDNDEECCSICLETINKNKNKVITNCGHIFHCICLIKNVSINGVACPYCRTNISEEEKIYEEISVEETPNRGILEYYHTNLSLIDNQTAINNLRSNDEIIRSNNEIIRSNDEIIRSNDEIIFNNYYIPDNDENIEINNIDNRYLSNHQSRINRRLNSSEELTILTREHQRIEREIQAAIQSNNIRIPPPTPLTHFERAIISHWRSSNI